MIRTFHPDQTRLMTHANNLTDVYTYCHKKKKTNCLAFLLIHTLRTYQFIIVIKILTDTWSFICSHRRLNTSSGLCLTYKSSSLSIHADSRDSLDFVLPSLPRSQCSPRGDQYWSTMKTLHNLQLIWLIFRLRNPFFNNCLGFIWKFM